MKKITIPFKGVSLKLFVILSILVAVVFSIIIYMSTQFYAHQIEKNIRQQVSQSGDLIRRLSHSAMLHNQRDELERLVYIAGTAPYIERIQIIDKKGIVKFCDCKVDLGKKIKKTKKICSSCHKPDYTVGKLPTKEIFFQTYRDNVRMLEMINPIPNEPACYEAACHAHSKDDVLLGIIDFKISLEELDKSAAQTRRKVLFASGILIFFDDYANSVIVGSSFQRTFDRYGLSREKLAYIVYF